MNLIAPEPGTRLAALKHEYTAKPLLSAPEAKFHEVLAAISGGRVHIMCKPRLADVFDHAKENGAFQAISQKHVDFLVCRPGDWMPMLGIEVDDSSHNREDRIDRNKPADTKGHCGKAQKRQEHRTKKLAKPPQDQACPQPDLIVALSVVNDGGQCLSP